MSIYRGWKPSDNYAPRSRENAEPVASGAPAPVHLRKAQPLDKLVPQTRVWIDSLPRDVQPCRLPAQFARIANNLAAIWDRADECRRYFDDLLVDRRGGRKGFPPEIVAELMALRRVHADAHPSAHATWQLPKR